ncbi:MAG: TRAP transporter small permease [Tropicimonas sp.]|uniref:TRAP transporter small permease n=1 Tax=Tropicimonas sp. TaxID=2067044 RepID=UPI003A8960F3
MLRSFNSVIERICYVAGGAFFLAFILCVLFQIASRNLLPGTFVWTDEVAMFCFVWSVFLGAAVGVRRGVHYVVEILPAHFRRTNLALTLLALILCLPLIRVLVINGWSYADMSWRRYSFSLGFPMFYQNVVVAVSGAAMALFSVELIVETYRRLFPGRS